MADKKTGIIGYTPLPQASKELKSDKPMKLPLPAMAYDLLPRFMDHSPETREALDNAVRSIFGFVKATLVFKEFAQSQGNAAFAKAPDEAVGRALRVAMRRWNIDKQSRAITQLIAAE